MATSLDRYTLEAIASYDLMHADLLREARQEERAEHPLTARRLRYLARIVARAADAEERPREAKT